VRVEIAHASPHGIVRRSLKLQRLNGSTVAPRRQRPKHKPEPQPFLQGANDQSQAQLSPDRRWIAYVSNESGPSNAFVAEFRFDSVAASAAAQESIRISKGGGFAPQWRHDGRELFYLTPDGSVMSVAIDTKLEF
jgi:hypothetical protein